jgi:hypothetical protein
MIRFKYGLLCAGLVVIMYYTAAAVAEEHAVKAKDFFEKGAGPITIKVGRTLIFDSADGEYVLNGRDLYVESDRVEIIGNVVIHGFPTDEEEAALGSRARDGAPGRSGGFGEAGQQGEQGHNGNDGPAGRDGPRIELRIGRVLGNGQLTIINNGAPGGPGQDGGNGGNGGEGGPGNHKNCPFGFGVYWRTEGGRGGDGAVGGDGGFGGAGGNGGVILYSKALRDLVRTGRVKLESQPGKTAQFGRRGLGGQGGMGGPTGEVGRCSPFGVARAQSGSSDFFRMRPPRIRERFQEPMAGITRCLDCISN